MNAFIIKWQRGQRNYECFVQQLKGNSEDIYIVNFKDSELIRQYKGTKACFHLGKQEREISINCLRRLLEE